MGYVENIDREWSSEPDTDRLARAIELRESDVVSALNDLEDLSKRGSPLAMLYIGDTHANGCGTARNTALGDEWYQKAVDHGSVEAAHRLAFGYYHTQRYVQAIKILAELSDRGFIPAMYTLGYFYANGVGIDKNLDKAMKYWTLAERGGHLNAKRKISLLFLSGSFGIFGRIRGLAKMMATIHPFAVCNVKNPRSDRLRDW